MKNLYPSALEPKVGNPTPAQIAQWEAYVLRRKNPAIREAEERERDQMLDEDYTRFAATMTAEDWVVRDLMVRLLREHQSQRHAARVMGVVERTFRERVDRYEIGDSEWLVGHHRSVAATRHFIHSPNPTT